MEKQAIDNNKDTFFDSEIGEIKTGKLSPSDFVNLCFDYYSLKWDHHDWDKKFTFLPGKMFPIEFVQQSLQKIIDFNNGEFDPRNRKIIDVEKSFDITFKQSWAKYKFALPNKEIIDGQLSLKGTIDFVTEHDEDTIEIIDWKTGKRLNWATGKEKTYKDLCDDKQLGIYHLAARELYPQYKHILITIFFINDGGAFTITFEPEDVDKTISNIRKKFDTIRTDTLPRKRTGFHCRFCHYYNNSFDNDELNMCNRIQSDLYNIGIQETNKKYMKEPYQFMKYKNPGE